VKRPKLHIDSPKCWFLLIFLTIEQASSLGRKMNASLSCSIGVLLALVKYDCQFVVSKRRVTPVTR
jgi:hypothetical protein